MRLAAPAQRRFTPRFSKPPGCTGCPIADTSIGYVPGYGVADRSIAFLAESPAVDEQIQGEPLCGAAGSMLTRILRMIGKSREDFRIDNLCRCTMPQHLSIRAFPQAIARCSYWRDDLTATPPKVIVTLGTVPTREVLGLQAKKHAGVEEFHGTVNYAPRFPGIPVIPTFHPSHLQRGATNLMGVVAFDLLRAIEIAKSGHQPDPAIWIVDPPLAWARAWADQALAARAQDPYAYPLAVDIETPDKGGDEGAIVNAAEDRSYRILRVNFSIHPDEGVTFPYEGEYIPLIHSLCASPGVRYLWFKGFDEPRLLAAKAFLPERSDRQWNWDCMWMAKAVQSDLPQGLGFWAPLYSPFGAWKHLCDSEPGKYAAIDAFQTRRVGDGLVSDLIASGMWDVFARHQHHFHQIVLQPATDVGVPVDRARLITFRERLDKEAARLLDQIQLAVPPELRPLTPKMGLTRPPGEADVHTKGRATTKKGVAKKEAPDPIKMALYARAVVVEKIVLREVVVCTSCAAQEISRTHRCRDRSLTPALSKQVVSVTRWFWHEPFNPDSPDQMMAYVKAKGHAPGKSKQTGNDAVDRETLSKLARETQDPFYLANLDYRAVGKVRGTYAIGTEKRLDSEDRLHGTFGYKPSTMRLCVASGTPIEIVRDIEAFPAGIPIEEITPGAWAYAFDDQLKLVLRRVVAVWPTGTKAVLRVHWMSGGPKHRAFGFVDVTPEHLIRRSDGTYAAAQDLVQGDSLLALRRGTRAGYSRIFATGSRRAILDHRLIFSTINGWMPEHVHHVNERGLDNRPENLLGWTNSEHQKYHRAREGPEVHQRRREGGMHKARFYRCAGRPRLNLTKEWLIKEMERAGGRITVLAKTHSIDYATLIKYMRRHDLPWRKMPRVNNHMVVFVETRPDPVPVYDLEIEEVHNFIAGEICVHNSGTNPNLQNITADKGGADTLAAGFRDCIVARGRMVEVGSRWED